MTEARKVLVYALRVVLILGLAIPALGKVIVALGGGLGSIGWLSLLVEVVLCLGVLFRGTLRVAAWGVVCFAAALIVANMCFVVTRCQCLGVFGGMSRANRIVYLSILGGSGTMLLRASYRGASPAPAEGR